MCSRNRRNVWLCAHFFYDSLLCAVCGRSITDYSSLKRDQCMCSRNRRNVWLCVRVSSLVTYQPADKHTHRSCGSVALPVLTCMPATQQVWVKAHKSMSARVCAY